MPSSLHGPPLRAAAAGLAAALLFGASPPLAKLLVQRTSPLLLAGLLYVGAALGLLTLAAGQRLRPHAAPRAAEAPLRRADAPLLIAATICGGALGPLLMLIGLQRVSALAGSLLLNLEAPATMLLAIAFFREHLSRRELTSAGAILLGAAILSARPGEADRSGAHPTDLLGALCLAGACLCWGLDNNLTQRLSLKDPLQISRIKTLAAGLCNLTLALLTHSPWPPARAIPLALLLGAFSYGLSIVLHTYALRALGAARQAALFATAPFVGALLSLPLLHDQPHAVDGLAALLMAAGVWLLLTSHHSHRHTHEPLGHEHLHHHDEHHQHAHPPDLPLTEPHAHFHEHARLTHEHPHTSDLHHRHRHD